MNISHRLFAVAGEFLGDIDNVAWVDAGDCSPFVEGFSVGRLPDDLQYAFDTNAVDFGSNKKIAFGRNGFAVWIKQDRLAVCQRHKSVKIPFAILGLCFGPFFNLNTNI